MRAMVRVVRTSQEGGESASVLRVDEKGGGGDEDSAERTRRRSRKKTKKDKRPSKFAADRGAAFRPADAAIVARITRIQSERRGGVGGRGRAMHRNASERALKTSKKTSKQHRSMRQERRETGSIDGTRSLEQARPSPARPEGLIVRPANAAIAARIVVARGGGDEEEGGGGEESAAADRGEELRVIDVNPA